MKHRNKKILSYIISILVVLSAAFWVCSRFIHQGRVEFTDNAEVCRRIVPVNSRVRGYIREIRFTDFQPVKKGDTLVIIDDSDLRLDLARASADYQNALAGMDVAGRSVNSANAEVSVSDASVQEARILMELAAADLERYKSLLEKDAVTRREFDAVETDYKAKTARWQMLKNRTEASTSAVDLSRSRISQSQAGIDLAKALLETAELNLSYSVILAPCDGYTSRKDIQTGQLVQPGQTMLDIVDSGEIWITANYKETQLQHIVPGSPVDIHVDAVPGVLFHGVVRSISTATGSSLSLLPQDNSTGNFVKVRRRVPVRIDFTAQNSENDLELLRAGMNVECEVRY
ncbi:MAG: HlyD family secretion protein [Muribaculaceae bacterium]|nr:HlyD family secretion protein [Muribaculaceae bacterium]